MSVILNPLFPGKHFIGGGLLIGLYYAYVNDDAKYLRGRAQSAE